jgi:hypothetical protein
MTVWLVEHWLAVALFGLYTIALMLNALTGLRASKSMRGFYVGNRNLSGPLNRAFILRYLRFHEQLHWPRRQGL